MSISKKFILLISIFCVFISLSSSKAQDQSLYIRLGSIYGIAPVIDDFVETLLVNPIVTTNKNVILALNKINKPGLKYLITEMVCELAGGPQKYSGRKMKSAHEGLNITEEEWQASVKDLTASLNKFKVPEKEQGELLTLILTTKSDIVVPLVSPSPEISPSSSAQPSSSPEQSPVVIEQSPSPEQVLKPAVKQAPPIRKMIDLNNLELPDFAE